MAEAQQDSNVYFSSNDDDETIEDWHKKEFLKEVEKAGGRKSGDLLFLQICNRDTRFYGNAASKRRRKFQILLDNFKRKKIAKYLLDLQRYGITPGPATVRESSALLSSPARDGKCLFGVV